MTDNIEASGQFLSHEHGGLVDGYVAGPRPGCTPADEFVRSLTADLGRFTVQAGPPAKPVTQDDLVAVMKKLAVPLAWELHCGIGVWDQLRNLGPAARGPAGLAAALGGAPLYGIPVHVDQDMPAGRWEMREGDQVVKAGDITPEQAEGALYVPGVGWVVFGQVDDV